MYVFRIFSPRVTPRVLYFLNFHVQVIIAGENDFDISLSFIYLKINFILERKFGQSNLLVQRFDNLTMVTHYYNTL